MNMQEAKVVRLTPQEKEELVEHIKLGSLNSNDKEVIIGLLNLYDDLKEKLMLRIVPVRRKIMNVMSDFIVLLLESLVLT